MTRLFTCLLVLGMSSSAVAQEPAPAGPFAPLATTDRTTDHTSVNASLGASFYGDGGPDFGARLDLFGEYLAPAGFGGYGSVPVSYVSFADESETGIGNIEAGGLYALRAGPTSKVLLRGGLMLPTASDDGGALANFASVGARLTDLPSVAADTTWLRVAASPLFRQGQLFLRADVGFDVAIDEPDGSDIDPLVRVNLAGGLQAGQISIAGEVATLGTTGDVADGEDRFLHTFGASVSFAAGSVRPYGALIIPIGDLADLTDHNFTLMGGIEFPTATR